jgi:hypothetical protein
MQLMASDAVASGPVHISWKRLATVDSGSCAAKASGRARVERSADVRFRDARDGRPGPGITSGVMVAVGRAVVVGGRRERVVRRRALRRVVLAI